MLHGPLPFIIALIVAAVVSGTVAAYSWRFRRTPIAAALIGLMACATFYAFGYALELSSVSLAHMLLWNKIQF
jgi:hypothetical protein